MERAPENQPSEDYSHFTDEDWELHEGLWGFDPEGFPQRELNASGDYDVVYYDSSYNAVGIVPITPDGRIDASRQAAQQPDEPPTPPTPEA